MDIQSRDSGAGTATGQSTEHGQFDNGTLQRQTEQSEQPEHSYMALPPSPTSRPGGRFPGETTCPSSNEIG